MNLTKISGGRQSVTRMLFNFQNDIEISTLSDAEKQDRIRQFELVQSKSDLSRNMQELLGVYLLFER